jgi:hypothetical protein
VVSATLEGLNGFTQSLSALDATAASLGTYSFNRLGFLLGSNLGTNRASFSNLLVTFVPAALPGDFNNDGQVDTSDYVVWRKQGMSTEKYQEWQANFGASSLIGASVASARGVPEPSAAMFCSIVAAVYFSQHRQWS